MGVREMVEIAEKAFAQSFAEPRVLKEWALRVEDRLEALERRVGEEVKMVPEEERGGREDDG